MIKDTISQVLVDLMLDGAFTGSGASVHVHLFTNNFVPTPLTPIANFTEVSADWYSVKTGTAGAKFDEPDNSLTIVVQSQQWNYASSTAAPITVYGYYTTDSSNTVLFSSHALPNPITLQDSLDAIIVEPVLNFACATQSDS